jgi:hypothetical protein
MRFKKYLEEETAAADIASVDNKLDMVKRPKHLNKGKRCTLHKELNCEECLEEHWDDDDDWDKT